MRMSLGIMALCVSVGAAATDVRQQTVSYADLNLRSASGVAALDRRLKTAVRNVCGNDGTAGVVGVYERRHCIAQAKASAARGRALALIDAGRLDQQMASADH